MSQPKLSQLFRKAAIAVTAEEKNFYSGVARSGVGMLHLPDAYKTTWPSARMTPSTLHAIAAVYEEFENAGEVENDTTKAP